MGVPGRVVREVTDDDLRRTMAIAAHYLELAQRYAAGAFPPPWQAGRPGRGAGVNAETIHAPQSEGAGFSIDVSSDRRADIEAKQGRVAALLRELDRDGLLLLDPENVSWMTSGATPRGLLDPESQPALFCTPEGRWLICSNVDTQRLFDEELDGLGFQLKEWPWHWGREQFLADLCPARKVACDRHPGAGVEGDFRPVGRGRSPGSAATLTALRTRLPDHAGPDGRPRGRGRLPDAQEGRHRARGRRPAGPPAHAPRRSARRRQRRRRRPVAGLPARRLHQHRPSSATPW